MTTERKDPAPDEERGAPGKATQEGSDLVDSILALPKGPSQDLMLTLALRLSASIAEAERAIAKARKILASVSDYNNERRTS